MKAKFVSPSIQLIAKTEPYDQFHIANEKYQEAGAQREFSPNIASVIEFAGRVCYRAFGKKNPSTATPDGYIANIMAQNHESVLEHVSFTFYLTGISRAATHEIVRHRHLSFSQESQRFVHGKDRNVVLPPLLDDVPADIPDEYLKRANKAFKLSEETYARLRAYGESHKKASEAARAILPNMAATSMVVTGNARSWKEFVQKRDDPAADEELQYIAGEIGDWLSIELPEVFGEEARSNWNKGSEQGGVKQGS